MESSNKEWSFLIKICDLFIAKNKDLQVVIPEGLDWDKFIELATHHRVLSIVYDQLVKIDKDVPNYIHKQLANYFKARTKFNLTLTSELIILLKLFKEKGLGIIPYKGVLLSHFVYGNLGTRPSADIDIMVREEELDEIIKYLDDHQYEVPEKLDSKLWKSYRANNCELSILKFVGDKNISIDTHWKIANRMLQMDVGYRQMKKESTIVDFFGQKINFLNPEALLIITSMHHFGKEKMVHLKQLIDLAMIVKHYGEKLDWEKVVSLSKQWKVFKLTMSSLMMVAELLEMKYPNNIEQQIRSNGNKRFIDNHLDSMTKSKGKYAEDIKDDFTRGLGLHLRLREGMMTKFKVLFFHIQTILVPNILDFRNPKKISSLEWYKAMFLKPFRLIKNYIIS